MNMTYDAMLARIEKMRKHLDNELKYSDKDKQYFNKKSRYKVKMLRDIFFHAEIVCESILLDTQ